MRLEGRRLRQKKKKKVIKIEGQETAKCGALHGAEINSMPQHWVHQLQGAGTSSPDVPLNY